MSAQELDRLARFRAMAEQHLERVGRAIELRREELGWSRPQLARAIPVADKTVGRWEKAETGGASESLDRIAEVMDTTSQAMMQAVMEEERRNRPASGEAGASPLDALSSPAEADARLRRLEEQVDEIAELLRRVRLHQLEGALGDAVEAEREAAALRSQPPARTRAASQ